MHRCGLAYLPVRLSLPTLTVVAGNKLAAADHPHDTNACAVLVSRTL